MIAQQQFDSILRLKDHVLTDLEEWSEAELCFKSAPGVWSALEVVSHLAKTDAGITAQMRERASAPLPLTLLNRFAGNAFNLVFRSSIRVKTPGAAAVVIIPVAPADLASAASAWDNAIEQLRSFLSSLKKRTRWRGFSASGGRRNVYSDCAGVYGKSHAPPSSPVCADQESGGCRA